VPGGLDAYKQTNSYQEESNTMKTSFTVKTVTTLLLGMSIGVNPYAMAQDSQTAATDTDEDKVAWTPPPPPPDEFDWIQLNSGEWLKGEFKVLYDDSVEFDSEELDRVMIVAAGESQEFNRADVISIAQGVPKEGNYWSGKFTLGLNISQGNSDRQDLNLALNAKRRTADSRFLTDYLGFYSKSDQIKTDDNHRLRSTYDIFRTRRFFWRPLLGEVFRDPFQNISYQLTVGAGAGYQLIDTSKTEWSIAAGPAFKYTKFETVEAGENDSESTPALWAGTNYDRELNSKMDLILGYNTVIGNQDSGGYTHHAIATLETELLSWLDFDTSFIWDHVQNPTRDSDGTVPDKNDYRFVIGLGMDF
jgi:putative salt-induced outer membrane protein YdiY